MNIAIDMMPILSPESRYRGIGRYCLEQIRQILRQDQANQYYLFNLYGDENIYEILGVTDTANCQIFSLYSGKNQFLLAKNNTDQNFQTIIGNIIRKFIADFHIDVFYLTSIFDVWDIYKPAYFEQTRLVITVYDLIPLIFEKQYLADAVTKKNYMKKLELYQRADRLFAISESAKNDLHQYLKIDEEKIDVIYAGVKDTFRELNHAELGWVLDKFHVKTPFLLYPGGEDQRKNYREIITAYAKLPTEIIRKYQLVMVFKLTKDGEAELRQIAKDQKVSDRVIITNYVTDEELVALYNLADLTVFPSKYEGFGLPVVESFACGTPVVTSVNSSLGEIAQDAAVLVDPFRIDSITRGIAEALTNADLKGLLKNGKEKLTQFTWENVAAKTITAFYKIEKLHLPFHKEKRKKIAMFTPLPPMQSGISDYSVDIINELKQYTDIDVFIEDYKPAVQFEENVHIHHHRKFAAMHEQYDEIVYQVGNSYFHSYMTEYIMRYSGVVVLHDCNLHGLLTSLCNGEPNEYYKKAVQLDYPGRECRSIDPNVIVNGFITQYAKKVIVHSDYTQEQLLRLNPYRSIYRINLYCKINDCRDLKRIFEKYQINEDDTVITALGIIQPTKRNFEVLQAVERLVNHDNIIKLKFILVGRTIEERYHRQLIEYIEQHHLQEHVVITGFVDLSEFRDFIEVSTVCVNLRYPYNGENSGSLAAILAAGRAALITDIGSFSEIPSDACVKLPPPADQNETQEVDCIYAGLKSLLADQTLLSRIQNNAKKYADEDLNLITIGKQYYACITDDSECYGISEKDFQQIMFKYACSEDEIYRITETISFLYEKSHPSAYIHNLDEIDVQDIICEIRSRI